MNRAHTPRRCVMGRHTAAHSGRAGPGTFPGGCFTPRCSVRELVPHTPGAMWPRPMFVICWFVWFGLIVPRRTVGFLFSTDSSVSLRTSFRVVINLNISEY
jgi:hypothetical protein